MDDKERGSASLEAAVIMSVFIFMITGVVYVSFYLHDVVVVRSTCIKVCEKYLCDKGDGKIANALNEELKNKLFVIKEIDVNGKVGRKVSVEVSGEYEGCGKGVLEAFAKGKYKYSYKIKMNVNKDDVYKVKVLKKLVDEIENED